MDKKLSVSSPLIPTLDYRYRLALRSLAMVHRLPPLANSGSAVAYATTGTNGLITFTSAIKLAIKLTIKLRNYCSYNKMLLVVSAIIFTHRALCLA